MSHRPSFLSLLASALGGSVRRCRGGGEAHVQVRGAPGSVRVVVYSRPRWPGDHRPLVLRVVVSNARHRVLELSCLPAELPQLVPWVAAWCVGGPLPASPGGIDFEMVFGPGPVWAPALGDDLLGASYLWTTAAGAALTASQTRDRETIRSSTRCLSPIAYGSQEP